MNNKIISILIGLRVISAEVVWYVSEKGNSTEIFKDDATVNTPVVAKPEDVQATYKDGTYTASGAYFSPAGAEEVEITLTLTSNIITDAQFVGKATNPGSVMAQKKFSEGFKEQVVGKAVSEVSLTVVHGSSLTPKGFMDALEKIKAQAKA